MARSTGSLATRDLSTEPFKESGWRPTCIEDLARATSTIPSCQNGHSVNLGDLICPNCGVDLNTTGTLTAQLHLGGEPQEQGASIIIDGWRLGRQLSSSSNMTGKIYSGSCY